MPEPRRLENSTPEPVDRDNRAEALLVEGLDCYFSGRYEDAIHVWTRVLFLDRSHARARAYIDRARTAIAERHRRSDEMLQAGHELLGRGDLDGVRRLLTQVVAAHGEDEQAAGLRVKLERAERAQTAVLPGRDRVGAARWLSGWTWPLRPRVLNLALGFLGAVVLGAIVSPVVRGWIDAGLTRESIDISSRPETLPVLSSSDVALVRARNLYNLRHLSEALRALERVSPNSPARAEADALRVEIQRLLLASGQDRSEPSSGISRQ